MGLFIAICFFLTSYIIVRFTKQNPIIANYDNVLFVNLLAINTIYYILSQDFSTLNLVFSALSVVLYLTSKFENKISYLTEVISLSSVCFIAYTLDFTNYQIALFAVLASFLYIGFQQALSNVIYVFITLLPICIYSIYSLEQNLFFITSIVTILASIRFFVENKALNSSRLLNNYIILILSYYVLSNPVDNINETLSAVFIALSYFIFTSIIQLIAFNKNSMIIRLLAVSDYKLPVYLKIFAFNIYCLLIIYLYQHYGFKLSICGFLIIIPLVLGYLKLWYLENDHNFN